MMKNTILFLQDFTPLDFYLYPFDAFNTVIISKWEKETRIYYAKMKDVKFGFVITKIDQHKL